MSTQKKLSDFVDIVSGYAIPSKHMQSEGTPILKITNIREDGSIDFENTTKYDLPIADKLNKFILKDRDILVCMTGATIGKSACQVKVNGTYLVNQRVAILRAKDIRLQKFVNYIVSNSSFREYAMRIGRGAAQPNISAVEIGNYEFSTLDSAEQLIKIGDILSAYDDLIEVNRKQIKLLEEAAQRLYKEWFVDLHFPGHENTKIVDGVPEGWEKRKIEELVNIKSGYAFKSKDWQSKGHPVVKIKDINGTFVLSDSLDCVPITVAKKANQFILRTGDLVIAMTGATIGKVGIVTEDNIYTNQRVGKFFVKDRFILPFLYCYFKQKSTIDLVLKISSSSAAQPNISGSQLGSFVFMYNKELLDKYCDKVQYLFQKIIMLQKQARLLTEARDRLLPKLMSGEIKA